VTHIYLYINKNKKTILDTNRHFLSSDVIYINLLSEKSIDINLWISMKCASLSSILIQLSKESQVEVEKFDNLGV